MWTQYEVLGAPKIHWARVSHKPLHIIEHHIWDCVEYMFWKVYFLCGCGMWCVLNGVQDSCTWKYGFILRPEDPKWYVLETSGMMHSLGGGIKARSHLPFLTHLPSPHPPSLPHSWPLPHSPPLSPHFSSSPHTYLPFLTSSVLIHISQSHS